MQTTHSTWQPPLCPGLSQDILQDSGWHTHGWWWPSATTISTMKLEDSQPRSHLPKDIVKYYMGNGTKFEAQNCCLGNKVSESQQTLRPRGLSRFEDKDGNPVPKYVPKEGRGLNSWIVIFDSHLLQTSNYDKQKLGRVLQVLLGCWIFGSSQTQEPLSAQTVPVKALRIPSSSTNQSRDASKAHTAVMQQDETSRNLLVFICF